MTTTVKKAPLTAEGGSIVLAIATVAYVAAWFGVVVLRPALPFGLAQEVAEPKWWFTAGATVWLPLIVFVTQMVLLAKVTLFSTHKEAAGTSDISTSQYCFTGVLLVTAAWVGMYVLNKAGVLTVNVPLTMNHVSGLAAFLFTSWAESRVTNIFWTVANRRPGGTIGAAA